MATALPCQPTSLGPAPGRALGARWRTHLVGEVEAVMGARQLQRPGVGLFPLQATVHTDLRARRYQVMGRVVSRGGGAVSGAGLLTL